MRIPGALLNHPHNFNVNTINRSSNGLKNSYQIRKVSVDKQQKNSQRWL